MQVRGGTGQPRGTVCGEAAVSPGRAVGCVGSWEAKEAGGRGAGVLRNRSAEEQGRLRGRVCCRS